MSEQPYCQCGDRSRPHINHRKVIPCWTYIGRTRYDIDKKGRVVRYLPGSPRTENPNETD